MLLALYVLVSLSFCVTGEVWLDYPGVLLEWWPVWYWTNSVKELKAYMWAAVSSHVIFVLLYKA